MYFPVSFKDQWHIFCFSTINIKHKAYSDLKSIEIISIVEADKLGFENFSLGAL